MGVALSNNSLVQTGTGALNRFPGTEYFTSLDASTEVKCGNSYMQDDRFTLPNGFPAALSKGDFWMDETSGSPELYFYGDGPGAPRLSHSTTAFLGDVTGTIASNTVEKIQGLDVLDAAPNDGDVLTWDDGNSRWAPAAPSSSGIPDPGTKATNDLLMYTGSAWDAKGAASGDRIGPIFGSAMDLDGHLTFVDNTYDIGASGATRPRTGYFGTSVVIGGNEAVTKDNVGAIGLNSVKGVTVTTSDTVLASYIWAANELLVSSVLEWDVVLCADSGQTYTWRLQTYNGSTWGDLFSATSLNSSVADILYTVKVMMDPYSTTRCVIWGTGSTNTTAYTNNRSIGSATFFTTASRGMRLVVTAVSGVPVQKGSAIMRELRGG